MKSLIFNLVSCLCIVVFTSFTVINSGDKCNLTIKIMDISAIKGDIYIAIYDSKDAFENKNAVVSKRLKVTAKKKNIRFHYQ